MGEYIAGRRVQVYFGSPPDLKQILDEERAGVRVYKGESEPRKPESMVVLGKPAPCTCESSVTNRWQFRQLARSGTAERRAVARS